MSRLSTPKTFEHNVGPCLCGTDPVPHPNGDIVVLRDSVSLNGGILVTTAGIDGGLPSDVTRRASLALMNDVIVDWNFLDDDGKPIPVTPENISLTLPWHQGGGELANFLADHYEDQLNSPLLTKNGKSSQHGQTNGSTSRRRSKATQTR